MTSRNVERRLADLEADVIGDEGELIEYHITNMIIATDYPDSEIEDDTVEEETITVNRGADQ